MDLTRRQVAALFTGLYAAGGALLLADYVADTSAPGAHLPLVWHVYPIALAAQAAAASAAMPGPLDAGWPATPGVIIASYIAAVLVCGGALAWLICGQAKSDAEKGGKERSLKRGNSRNIKTR